MLKKMMFGLVALSVFMVIPAFAQHAGGQNAGNSQDSGCREGKFVGSYNRVTSADFGPPIGIHTFLFQLTLNSDGTANQQFTFALDYPMNAGAASPDIGSWKCRKDGKLVVTVIHATYTPTAGPAPFPPFRTDIELNPSTAPNDNDPGAHVRTTYLFSVTDANTLTRVQQRQRHYTPTQDPTDPNGGTLGTLVTVQRVYKRLVASDADLLAP